MLCASDIIPIHINESCSKELRFRMRGREYSQSSLESTASVYSHIAHYYGESVCVIIASRFLVRPEYTLENTRYSSSRILANILFFSGNK